MSIRRRPRYLGLNYAALGGAPSLLNTLSATSTAAFSVRKVRDAYSGSCLRVRRSSDDTEQDIGFSSGVLDIAALRTFVGTGSGYVKTWYNQAVGGSDAAQATAANQPAIVVEGNVVTYKDIPALYFHSGQWLDWSISITSTKIVSAAMLGSLSENAQTYSRLLVLFGAGTHDYNSPGTAALILRNVGTEALMGFRNGVGNLSTAAIAFGVPRTVFSIFDGTNHTLYLQNVAATPVASSADFVVSTGRIGSVSDAGTAKQLGWTAEVMLFSSALGSSDRAAIYASQTARFGYKPLIAAPNVPNVILDVDMDADRDDVGDLAVAVNAHRTGQINLIAATCCSSHDFSAAALKACLVWAGLDDIPVGAYKGIATTDESVYAEDMANSVPETTGLDRTDFSDATVVLRTALAGVADKSVTILTTGQLRNMMDLRVSSADGISALDGMALIRAKVRFLAMAAGGWGGGAGEYNITTDLTGATDVINDWPTLIVVQSTLTGTYEYDEAFYTGSTGPFNVGGGTRPAYSYPLFSWIIDATTASNKFTHAYADPSINGSGVTTYAATTPGRLCVLDITTDKSTATVNAEIDAILAAGSVAG
jgi:hypothetical protein